MEIRMALAITAAAAAAFAIRRAARDRCSSWLVMYGAVGIGIIVWFILSALGVW